MTVQLARRFHGQDNPAGHGFSLGVTLLRPSSRGSIRLRSADLGAPTVIRANYFSAAHDLNTLADAMPRALAVLEAAPLAPYRGQRVWPGAKPQHTGDWIAFLRATCETLYHPVGTCKMGPATDNCAVVGAQLRVHGLAGLRVADASVMPAIVGGNTNAPTIMIAEKAADMLRRR